MPSQYYNKAIRDGVPEAMLQAGKQFVLAQATIDDFVVKLMEKIDEELAEFKATPSAEELADVIEVVRAIAMHMGIEWHEVESARLEKLKQRGGFEQRLVLERVDE